MSNKYAPHSTADAQAVLTDSGPEPTAMAGRQTTDLPPIVGAVPRIEKQYAHRNFLEAVAPAAALINIVHVRRLLKAGHTADSWFPDPMTVLTTTTVADNRLARIDWTQELAFIKAFEPDYHLPTDYPVYGDWDPERRVENTKRCAKGTLYAAEELADSSTSVIPLIKGTNPAERYICESVAADLDADIVAKYGAQYYTVPGSGQFPALRDDVAAIADEIRDDQQIFVIGSMSPSGKFGVQKFPAEVCAVAGSRWYETVEPRSASPIEMQDRWTSFQTEVLDALAPESPTDPDYSRDQRGP